MAIRIRPVKVKATVRQSGSSVTVRTTVSNGSSSKTTTKRIRIR